MKCSRMKIAILTSIIPLLLNFSLMAQSNPQPAPKTTVKIEIWSDVVCPFCFLGKKKMEQAIQKLDAEDKVEIIWHSFQLDPDFPLNTAVPSMENLSERKGYPIEQVRGMCDQLTAQGKAYQIDFHFDNALTFNTQNAHRLLHWAKTHDKSSQLKEALMYAYFTAGTDLSQQENLLAVVEKVGLDTTQAKEVLQSDAYQKEVEQDIKQARKLRIGGVPFFLVNEEQGISGAQPDQVFEEVIGAALQGR